MTENEREFVEWVISEITEALYSQADSDTKLGVIHSRIMLGELFMRGTDDQRSEVFAMHRRCKLRKQNQGREAAK
jgi:hypothetical protein